MVFILMLVCGCTPAQSPIQTSTPALPATPTLQQASATSEMQTATASSTASPSATPVVQLCSALEGIGIEQLADLITNPYHPPPPGSDDPHVGIDLSDMLPDTQIAVSGRTVQAVMNGLVSGVIHDRFPYGNAILIETSLTDLPAGMQISLALPTPDPSPAAPVALSCPEGMDPVSGENARSLYILYAHMQEPSVLKPGDAVTCGQTLGKIGASGNALNPHLHLEMRVGSADTRFQSMAHYDVSASLAEMAAYCTWRVGGKFQSLDPMNLFILIP